MIWLFRHSETEWSRSGRHTSLTDLPLTEEGARMARALAPVIAGRRFCAVLTSPLRRARETCDLVGLGAQASVEPALLEWNYGQYEGITTAEIKRTRPDWDLWRHGCPGGESLEDVAGRARGVVQRLIHEHGQEAERQHGTAAAGGAGGAGQMPQERRSPDVAVFSHGHFLRALVAVWLELPASRGRSFGLHADSVSILGFEHGNPVVWSWDWTEHLLSGGH